jgi:hypothetical protein
MKSMVKFLAVAGVVFLVGQQQATAASPPTVVLLGTALSDANNRVVGLAGYQSITRNANTRAYFEVVLGGLSVPADSTLNVLVNGTQVATATTRSWRGSTTRARVVLSSPRGDTVPAVTAGATITVVDAATGATIAVGTFRQFR